jgi:D-alanyl-D-alanine carboxypeptidase (penicillin-binding protein 5/6)
MKKIILIVILFLFSITNVKGITASSAVAMDLNSGRVLYDNNMNNKRLIASITKIMTCIIVLENSDIKKEITVGDEVLKAYGSAIYIEMGEKITIENLLYGLMLRSGNDAAIVLAKNVSGNMDNFVKLMNELAGKIGMKNTTFINDNGLEDNDGNGNISTAYDMALLTTYAYKNDKFRKIIGTKDITVKSSSKTYRWHNKNKLLQITDFVTGGKTGYTKKAKRTLVTTAEKNNKKITVVTLNDGNDFADHLSLYNELFKKYNAIKVIDKKTFTINNCNTCKIDNDYYALVTKDEENKLLLKVNIEEKKDNNYYGTIDVYLKDYLLHSEPIYNNIEKDITYHWWNKIIDWFKSW